MVIHIIGWSQVPVEKASYDNIRRIKKSQQKPWYGAGNKYLSYGYLGQTRENDRKGAWWNEHGQSPDTDNGAQDHGLLIAAFPHLRHHGLTEHCGIGNG